MTDHLFGRLLGASLLVSLSLGAEQAEDGLISGLLHCTSICPDQILPDLSKQLHCREGVPAIQQESH